MSFKIAFIGAGSIGFTRKLLTDLLSVPEMQDIDVAFHDISEQNLDMVTRLCQRDIDSNKLEIKIQSTLDRREAIKDAKYVFNVTRIGGLEGFEKDIEIPLKYNIDQCVGDTLCAGGIMYAQRGIPAILDFCKDIREVGHPDAVLLSYGNPNAMLTWAANKYGNVKTVGLCHGVQGGIGLIAKALEVDKSELDFICAGINHQTWYVQVLHKGEDVTGRILEAMENNEEIRKHEKVRIDMMRRFGYFSTESNGHLSEYVPWYRKREEEISDWISLDSWIQGETGGYLRVCREGRNWFETDFPNWMQQPPKEYKPENRSHEHGAYILEALETGRLYRPHVNVPNNGTITNLPSDAVVEVPAYVDRNGVNVPRVGDLPMGCAAVCNASITVQRLAVEAAVYGDDQLLRQAMMMDPLVGAVCNPPEIWQLVDEMLVAEEKWLPQYTEAIAQARKNLARDDLIPTRENYEGAARVAEKSVEQMAANREAATKNAQESEK